MDRSTLLALLLSLCSLADSRALARQAAEVVSIPYEYTYLLPNNFDGNSNYTFVNGTQTGSNKINSLFEKAKQAPIISYDQEFLDIVGSNPEVTLVAERAEGHDFAYESKQTDGLNPFNQDTADLFVHRYQWVYGCLNETLSGSRPLYLEIGSRLRFTKWISAVMLLAR
jgi:hypothetical protein